MHNQANVLVSIIQFCSLEFALILKGVDMAFGQFNLSDNPLSFHFPFACLQLKFHQVGRLVDEFLPINAAIPLHRCPCSRVPEPIVARVSQHPRRSSVVHIQGAEVLFQGR
jgi:hypothetical protein